MKGQVSSFSAYPYIISICPVRDGRDGTSSYEIPIHKYKNNEKRENMYEKAMDIQHNPQITQGQTVLFNLSIKNTNKQHIITILHRSPSSQVAREVKGGGLKFRCVSASRVRTSYLALLFCFFFVEKTWFFPQKSNTALLRACTPASIELHMQKVVRRDPGVT